MKQKQRIQIYYKILILFIAISCTSTAFAKRNVVLTGVNGKHHAIRDYIGKGTWTLVNFWSVHCPPCREEMPELVLLHNKYSKTLVSVVGIAIGFPGFGYPDISEVHGFLQEYKVDFPVLMGNANVANELGANTLEGLPTSLMYTPDGKLIAERTGPITQQSVLNFIKKYKEKHKNEKNMKK